MVHVHGIILSHSQENKVQIVSSRQAVPDDAEGAIADPIGVVTQPWSDL